MSFSCAGTPSSEMKLVKNLLRTRLKQSNLVNRPNISTENPKEDFNDTPFQLTTTSSSIFVFYSTYLVVILPFRMIFSS